MTPSRPSHSQAAQAYPQQADLTQQAIAQMRRFGADSADVLIRETISLGASCRLGRIESVERAETQDIGLRAIIGKKQAFVSGSGIMAENITTLAEQVIAMAQAASDDSYCGLAEKNLLADDFPDLDLYDDNEPDSDSLSETALQTESIARQTKGISNSEGGGAHWSKTITTLATSDGFCASRQRSSWSLSCAVIAGEGDHMECDGASHNACHQSDLESPQQIGTRAAKRALERLNPRKIDSVKLPVIFSNRVSASLAGHFAGAICGQAIARGTSFLKDDMGKAIFAPHIDIIDDPLRRRGLSSMAFDGEGVRSEKLMPVEQGRLKTWFLDSATARQLQLHSNGRARRSIGGPPVAGSTNLYIRPGKQTLAELMSDIGNGFYVTELIGMGVNAVTGDYSRGASGFMIENGKRSYRVSEMTLAGNLKTMFAQMTPADNLEFRYAVNAPALRIEEMTLAGL